MDYSQSLHYLNGFLDLEKLSSLPQNTFFNLKRMEHLLKAGGHPEKKFLAVLIAGTTGKGSTGFFLESILRANRVPVGYYHSPHVEDVRERIRIDGKTASGKLWAEGLSGLRKLLRRHPLPRRLGALTYFEAMTFLAVLLFSKTKRRIGIFEVGLGGRLDATNVLKAPLVIFTPIHLDHEAFLGDTVPKIAREKAGIIKKGSFVVTVPQLPGAAREIQRFARANKARLFEAEPYKISRISLEGDFQKVNAGAAIQAARILRLTLGVRIDPATYCRAMLFRDWAGRMERSRKFGREFILDGAHNPFSVKNLVRSLKTNPCKDPVFAREHPAKTGSLQGGWIIFGAMQDKNSKAMLKILARHFNKIIVASVRHLRAKPVGLLLQEAKGLFKCVFPAQNVDEAIRLARNVSSADGTIVITGSFYLVGEARKILKNAQA